MGQDSGSVLKEAAAREGQSQVLDALQLRVTQLESAITSDIRRISDIVPVASAKRSPVTPTAGSDVGARAKQIAAAFCVFAVLLPIVASLLRTTPRFRYAWTPGGVIALSATLIAMAIVFRYPAMLGDNQPGETDGQASTMRILCLTIVGCFCVITLRNAWNLGQLPTLNNESNWVWLLTAALGGKALQKFAEIKDPKGNVQNPPTTSNSDASAAVRGEKRQ